MGQETGSYWTDIFAPEDTGDIVSLPKFEVKESGGGNVFNPFDFYGIGAGDAGFYASGGYSRKDLGFGPGPNVTLGGSGLELPQEGGVGSKYATPLPSSGKEPWTNIYNQALAGINAANARDGKPPASLNDLAPGGKETVGEYLIRTADAGFDWETNIDASKAAAASRNSAMGSTSQKMGIPIVIPLPVSGATAAILTAAGLIASGGNIATIDPSNPVQSSIDAAKGVGNTIVSIPGQIAGAVGLGGNTGTGTTTGTTGTNMGGEAGGTGTEGTILVPPGAMGGNSGNTNTTPGDTGTPSTGTSTPGIEGTLPSNAADQAAKQAADKAAADAARQSVLDAMSGVGKTQVETNPQNNQTSDNDFWNRVLGGVFSTQQKNQPVPQRIGGLDGQLPSTGSTVISSDTSTKNQTNLNLGGNTGTNTYTFVFTPYRSTYTPMATNVYQRNLPKELSQSTSALFGQIPLVNAQGQPTGGTTTLMGQYGDIYQNLLGQTMLGNAQQPGLTSQLGQQLTADQAKLQRIQSGQLAAEDVRNAQQAAREAYGARGQVMGQGAIGAEILNREAIRQQRENEARAAYQGSVQNALSATNLQTGNIFSPVGSLIGNTFNPLAPYEADVYGTNVNALNADQIAAANRQAALEAAKLGQTGTYAQALGTFLGSPQGQSTVSSFIDLLLGRGTTPRT